MKNREDIYETDNLLLRRPTATDGIVLRDLWRNEKVRLFLGGIVTDTEIIEKKIVSVQEHWDKHKFGQWAVFEKISKEVIGICGLHHSEEGIELSYMFFPEFWGKGRGFEAASASLDYGFDVLLLERITAITQKANESSCRLLNKIGMNHINTILRFNAVQYIYEITQS